MLFSGQECPAQPKKPSTPSRQAFSAPNCSSATGEGQIPVHFCLLLEGCSVVLKQELTQHLSRITREKHKSHLLCSFPPIHADDKSQEGKGLHGDANDHPIPQTCSNGKLLQGGLDENLPLPATSRMPKDFSPTTFKETAPGGAGSKPGFPGTHSVPAPNTAACNPAPLIQRKIPARVPGLSLCSTQLTQCQLEGTRT